MQLQVLVSLEYFQQGSKRPPPFSNGFPQLLAPSSINCPRAAPKTRCTCSALAVCSEITIHRTARFAFTFKKGLDPMKGLHHRYSSLSPLIGKLVQQIWRVFFLAPNSPSWAEGKPAGKRFLFAGAPSFTLLGLCFWLRVPFCGVKAQPKGTPLPFGGHPHDSRRAAPHISLLPSLTRRALP